MAGRAGSNARKQLFYVTRESQNAGFVHELDSAKLSYVGMRNLSDMELIDEQDIVSARGTIRGKKNRVRAGLANFENPKALEKLNTEKGKVVVYVTSFRGVRSTFEECRYVLDLFHNLRVHVESRDIYVNQFYLRELEERLRQYGHISVPQVFIGGQHVGGKSELEELNETGELRKILEDYSRYETANNCRVCGGYEVIPCQKCGGSKNSTANKFTLEFRALRCTHCNENGMEVCPECVERRETLEKELKKKMSLKTGKEREAVADIASKNERVMGTEAEFIREVATDTRRGEEGDTATAHETLVDQKSLQLAESLEAEREDQSEQTMLAKGEETSSESCWPADHDVLQGESERGDSDSGDIEETTDSEREEVSEPDECDSEDTDNAVELTKFISTLDDVQF